MSNKLIVEINGTSYPLRNVNNPEKISKAANLVDKEIRKLIGVNPYLTKDKAAALVALGMAEKFLIKESELENYESNSNQNEEINKKYQAEIESLKSEISNTNEQLNLLLEMIEEDRNIDLKDLFK